MSKWKRRSQYARSGLGTLMLTQISTAGKSSLPHLRRKFTREGGDLALHMLLYVHIC